MRVQVLSDLHFEFHRDGGEAFVQSLNPSGVDVLILAGDIALGYDLWHALALFCKRYENAHVLYVLGNHEYYRSSPAEVERALKDVRKRPWATKNLHILQDDIVDIQGVRFAGSTLWFRDDPMNTHYKHHLNDFNLIRGFQPWVYESNQKSEAFLRESMYSKTPPDVIITHHLPSEQCVDPVYKGSPLNRFFVAPIADTMSYLPKVWVFGHTHSPMDMTRGGCRFICNPLGYPNEGNTRFRSDFCFDLQPG